MFEDPLCSSLASMARTPAHPRGRTRVRMDAHCFTPGNFKTDATVRPSHGRPHGHRPTVRLSVCPSVIVRVTTMVHTYR
jgi:hypothetical protein